MIWPEQARDFESEDPPPDGYRVQSVISWSNQGSGYWSWKKCQKSQRDAIPDRNPRQCSQVITPTAEDSGTVQVNRPSGKMSIALPENPVKDKP